MEEQARAPILTRAHAIHVSCQTSRELAFDISYTTFFTLSLSTPAIPALLFVKCVPYHCCTSGVSFDFWDLSNASDLSIVK